MNPLMHAIASAAQGPALPSSHITPMHIFFALVIIFLFVVFGDGGGSGGEGAVSRGSVNPAPPLRPFERNNQYHDTNTRRAVPREIIDEPE